MPGKNKKIKKLSKVKGFLMRTKKGIKKTIQGAKNKFRENVTKNDTRKVVNTMLEKKNYSKGGIIQHD